MKLDLVISWMVLVTVGMSGCAASGPTTAAKDAAAAESVDAEAVELHRDGRFIVSAQPDRRTLENLAGEGVTTVISCRSDNEMAKLGFDQRAAAADLGLRYVHIPMGGDHGYDPGQIAAFADSVRSIEGPVYVHCASGGRARYAIMGYLIREQGFSADEAMAASRRLGSREPILDQLLGETVRYGLTERDLQSSD
ncbi:MAG: sulfur transferase domain-containing protein [Planctomycetota bacterium]